MGHVLHLIAPRPATASRLALTIGGAAAAVAPGHTVVLIGGSDEERCARRAGLESVDRVHPPRSDARRASSSLRRLCAARGWPDAIVCWDEPALTLAARACPATPRLALLDRPPGATTHGRALRAAGALFADKAIADGWCSGGAPSLTVEHVDVAPPPRSAPHEGEPVSRAHWAGSDAQQALVVGLVGAPLGGGDAHLFGFCLGALGLAGWPVVGVAPAGASQLLRALRGAEQSSRWRLVVDDLSPPGRIETLDLALWLPAAAAPDGPFEHPVGLRRALRAGAAAVAPDSDQSRALVGGEARLTLAGWDRLSLAGATLRAVDGLPSTRPDERRGDDDDVAAWRCAVGRAIAATMGQAAPSLDASATQPAGVGS